MSIKVKGLEGIMDQLKEISAQMAAKHLAAAARQAMKPVAETAKALVPVDTGTLRDAIAVRTAKGKNDSVAVAGLVVLASTTKSKHALLAAAAFNESQDKSPPASRRWHFIELGTSHQAAKPFLRPALDTNATAVVSGLSDQLRKVIEKAAKKASKKGK